MDFVGNLLLSSFPNLTKAQVAGFVSGLLTSDSDLNSFKLHLRDFLVTLKVCVWTVCVQGYRAGLRYSCNVPPK